MTRFKTLLLREWMQHRLGWLILLGAPFVLFAAVGLAGGTVVELDGGAPPMALTTAGGVILGLIVTTVALAWGAALLQSPGLARRDLQDRSIEFWLSLPVGDTQSVGAPLVAHLVLLPLAALGVGLASGLVLTLPLVARGFGVEAWFALPWGPLLAAVFALALRLALGIVLATLWMAPLVLLTMAASAWLKRWGVPAVAALVGLGGLVLDRVYGNPVVWNVIGGLTRRASQGLFAADRSGAGFEMLDGGAQDAIVAALSAVPGWCLHDAGKALLMLASPAFLAALAVSAGGFALVVLRRRRGA